jgi:hypothetical protein
MMGLRSQLLLTTLGCCEAEAAQGPLKSGIVNYIKSFGFVR